MTLFQQTVSGIVWFFSGQIARMGLQLIVLMMLARLIEVKVFGAISVFMAIINFSSMFASIGAGPALILHRNINPLQLNTGFTISLSMGIFCINSWYK